MDGSPEWRNNERSKTRMDATGGIGGDDGWVAEYSTGPDGDDDHPGYGIQRERYSSHGYGFGELERFYDSGWAVGSVGEYIGNDRRGWCVDDCAGS